MHLQEDPDGLLTPEDEENIGRVKKAGRLDRTFGTNFSDLVDEEVSKDIEQARKVLKEKKEKLEQ